MKSEPKSYSIILKTSFTENIKLIILEGKNKNFEIEPINGIYKFEIPSINGGYNSFLGIKFNKKIPEEVKVIKITNNKNIEIEYSTNEIEQFEKDENGNYIINLN